MNFDDFEDRLKEQPLRQVPAHWRKEILLATQAGKRTSQTFSWPQFVFQTGKVLSMLLWPSPKAWASLAAVWLVLLIVNISSNNASRAVAAVLPRTEPEKILAWREEQLLLTELLGSQEMPIADRPKPAAPRPRSERPIDFMRV